MDIYAYIGIALGLLVFFALMRLPLRVLLGASLLAWLFS